VACSVLASGMGASVLEFGVLVVLAYGVPFVLWTLTQRLRSASADRALAPLGMPVRQSLFGNTSEARGLVDGLRVRVRYQDLQQAPRKDQPWGPPVARCEIRVDLPCPMPDGLRVHSMNLDQHLVKTFGGEDLVMGDERLDDAVRIGGDDAEEVRALLLDPRVRSELIIAARHAASRLDIVGRRLTYVRRGESAVDPRPAYDIAVSLAGALRDATGRTWRDFAVERGLRVSEGRMPGDLLLDGELEGVPVRVRLFARRGRQAPRVMVEAVFQPKLPGGLRLRPRKEQGKASRDAVSTGNPVLDTVAELTCTDAERARRLLAHDALTAPLMEVLHGASDAQILPGGVAVRVERQVPDEVDGALEAVVRLAGAFRQAAG